MKKNSLVFIVSLLTLLSSFFTKSFADDTLLPCLTPEDNNSSAARPAWNRQLETSDETVRSFSGQLQIHCMLTVKHGHTINSLDGLLQNVLHNKLLQDGKTEAEDGTEIIVKRKAQVSSQPAEVLPILEAETQLAAKTLWTNAKVDIYLVEEVLQKVQDDNKVTLSKNIGLANTQTELLLISQTIPESIRVISSNPDDQKYEKALKKLVQESYLKNLGVNTYEFSLRLMVQAKFPASEDNFQSLVSQLKNRMRKPLKDQLREDLLPSMADYL